MLHMGLPIRCVALDGPGGYDTHENQATSLQNNLTSLAGSLAAFQADLENRRRRAARSRAACSSTCGASSAAAPPRTAPAPTTARPARRC